MSGPLDGILVISLEQAVAAPYLSCRLADAGARVIKVERPEGDFARNYDTVVNGESAYFVWLNRGKESVQIDIKKDEDLALLKNMIDKADVFIQNLAPGVVGRYGLDCETLQARNPRLITVDISGYGEDGPYAKMKAYDMLVQSETGLAMVTGSPEGPGRVGVSVCDIAAGMHGLVGVLEALYERDRTGRGRAVKSTLFAGMADWMTVPLLHQEYGGKAPGRGGLSHPSIAPYEAYETAEGGPVVISIQNQTEWRNLCEHGLQNPALADDPRFATNEQRVANRPALNAEIDKIFGQLPRTEVIERLQKGRIAFGALNSVADLSHHPQLERTEVQSSAGPVNLIASPIHLSGETGKYGSIPSLGEHNQKIRDEFSA
ncbi:CoA transferase [Sneathiella sp. CAU 1612]|jgi:itaconate CoA-transferase|uniref:CoA transferase n=1 Tax=Sneathiella sedimenti TaxID=2816034 RepID=A0ABS3F764_9PROT|nr:CaiB/BaiF CoA-transferase family protein [Sneathiella sedimenti]MBO0333777.1 CoA transferase [Sneathiella sedimenti]